VSDVLKKNPFPVFQGERFLSEDVCWIAIGIKYNFVFINKPIYVYDYLEGGLTDTDKKIKFRSPQGSMMRGKMLMKKRCGIRQNIKGAIIYNCYRIEVKNVMSDRLTLDSLYEKFLVAMTLLPGRYYNKKWRTEC
jgi:hypothetical protein